MALLPLKLALSSGYVLASLMRCPAQPPPKVTLDFRNEAPVWRNDQTMEDLGTRKIDTVFSQAPREVFKVGGLTESRIESGFRIHTRTLTHPATRKACVWAETIDLKVVYAPVVHVAKEFRPGSCNHGVTAQHELRHVSTDIITLKEYLPKMKAGVSDIVRSLRVMGPLPGKKTEEAQDLFAAVVRAEVERWKKSLENVRMTRQQQIDTRQEYLRLGKACR